MKTWRLGIIACVAASLQEQDDIKVWFQAGVATLVDWLQHLCNILEETGFENFVGVLWAI